MSMLRPVLVFSYGSETTPSIDKLVNISIRREILQELAYSDGSFLRDKKEVNLYF